MCFPVGVEMTNEKMIDCSSKRSFISDVNGEALFADGFDDAIMGYDAAGYRVVYDYDKCIEILAKDMTNLDDDDDPYMMAVEYFDFNVIGAYMGESTPVFIRLQATEETEE